jgi:hypothetical protein
MALNEKVFEQFCVDNPEYSNEKSPERQLGDKLFRQKFLDPVLEGKIDHRTALDEVKDEVERQFALKEVGQLRSARTVAKPPSFYRGEAIEEPKGGISAGSRRTFA